MYFIDKFLNQITMYRLVLYGLGILALISLVAAMLGKLFFTPEQLLISLVVLLVTCFGVNVVLAKIHKLPMNLESADITALILFFIMAPPESFQEVLTLVAVGVIAMVSKYILAIKRKHIFNPAAVAVLIISLAGSGMAIWWVGSSVLLPFTLILGLLVVRKIRRFEVFGTFLVISLITLIMIGVGSGEQTTDILSQAFVSWPLLFFGSIMLTEPATIPPAKHWQLVYGAIVGVLFSSQFKVGPLYSTPELALVLGNIFSFIVSPKIKLQLVLESSKRLSGDIHEFIFKSSQKFVFQAGQYLEWTLPRFYFDSRGNRRYFTIASSPTENTIHLGIRTFADGSEFKKQLVMMKPGQVVTAAQLSGDFILPTNKNTKLVFIAGGIGITPFRSMVKYLIDRKEKRDIILLYACIHPENFVYKDIFSTGQEIGLTTEYIVTDKVNVPSDWTGQVGYIDEKLLQDAVPDYQRRTYFLSGPETMVKSYYTLLRSVGISKKQIKKDYFPGF